MPLDSKTKAVASYSVSLALYAARHETKTGYTQRNVRWDGIDNSRDYPELPHWADCSSFCAWLAWASRRHVRGRSGADVINNERWLGGFTGTMITCGARHKSTSSCEHYKPGRTAVFYASSGSKPTHVAWFVGDIIWHGEHLRDQVISHGRMAGPEPRPWNYRRVVQARAYPL